MYTLYQTHFCFLCLNHFELAVYTLETSSSKSTILQITSCTLAINVSYRFCFVVFIPLVLHGLFLYFTSWCSNLIAITYIPKKTKQPTTKKHNRVSRFRKKKILSKPKDRHKQVLQQLRWWEVHRYLKYTTCLSLRGEGDWIPSWEGVHIHPGLPCKTLLNRWISGFSLSVVYDC